MELDGFQNPSLAFPPSKLLQNIQAVQHRQNLPQSTKLESTKVCPINLDIEMETGTGKTYCYIKSMFELNQRYGWNKFIIVVPSIAIREGVAKSFEITADHLRLKNLESFFTLNKDLALLLDGEGLILRPIQKLTKF